MTTLTRVQRATRNRERSETEWRTAIRSAREDGESLRRIAKAAGITHVRVLQIVRE